MRFLITWGLRNPSEANQARLLSLLAKWQPPLDLHEWSGFADGTGGMCIAETDDVNVLAAATAPWAPYLEFTIRPIVPLEQSAAALSDAAGFWSSVT
jgi:hypothetical protein